MNEDTKATLNINKIYVRLYSKTVSPEAISEILNLKPTAIGHIGEEQIVSPRLPPRKLRENYWELNKEWQTAGFISGKTEGFIRKVIKPRIKAFKRLKPKCELIFNLTQYYYAGSNPGYCFSSEALEILSSSGFAIDIDTYVLSD